MIRVCYHCEKPFTRRPSQEQPVMCDDCGAVYHVGCWDEYEQIHRHECRVCVEREEENLEATK